ncbi:helix-turn-helix domain-containing protein [Xanthobacter sp. AM11]|uniref:helix-turn-helix domain-containing protein n=1 Tax=Xanthobacter sp. AM11 TaxID=3380643 RepID=UPI0039BF1961
MAEIAKLFGIHRNTVRRWLKEGLEAIDHRRPVLIHGSALKAYLTKRRAQRRQTCRPGEFYCFRCRAPRATWGAMADVSFRSATVARLSALCACCETPMHRTIRRADLPALAALVDLRTVASERMNERSDPSANRAFEEV